MKKTMMILTAVGLLGSTAAFAQETQDGAQDAAPQHHGWHHRGHMFGQRMIEVAGRTGAQVIPLTVPWGSVFDLDQLRAALKTHRPKVLAIVQAETSTGAWQPIEQLGKLCHEFDTLLLIDSVTALGCVPLELDKWEVDAVYSCTQKGLGCPPGLAPVFRRRTAGCRAGRRRL